MIIKDQVAYLLEAPSKEAWKKTGTQKRSGVVVPLFSIRSRESTGIGDFLDLKLLVDWCEKSGNSILQLLPLNETGSTSCPYDAISSFALEPVYVSLRALVPASNKVIRARIDQLGDRFSPRGTHLDYAIKEEKMKLLWEIFLAGDPRQDPAFVAFREANRYWIEDYCLYKALKRRQEAKPWYEWQEAFRNRSTAALREFGVAQEQEIVFHAWVQWQLYRQFREAKQYAAAKRILIKGDLPILVSRDSADVWAHPEFFKLQYAAGAPPDMYCAKGQRWGMPTYDWERIASDDFRYPRAKFRYAQNFYDVLRIDHVVGLFRIWSIPYDEPLENQGLNGLFDPKDEKIWGDCGRMILGMMLKSSGMLLCAEDLGTIPKACTAALKDLGIPGNDVQRWTKDWKKRHDFLPADEYRLIAVAMLSTHDTTNWPAWWEYEAGTIDEALFIRKCVGRVDYAAVRPKLFNPALSRYGRLRWVDSLDSTDELASIMGKRSEDIADFIDLYVNSSREKEKLWDLLGLGGHMRERPDPTIVQRALQFSLDSAAIFCINTIIDWLYLADVFAGDPYACRFNTPGTTSSENWSFILPLSLEEMLAHPVCAQIRQMVGKSGRL